MRVLNKSRMKCKCQDFLLWTKVLNRHRTSLGLSVDLQEYKYIIKYYFLKHFKPSHVHLSFSFSCWKWEQCLKVVFFFFIVWVCINFISIWTHTHVQLIHCMLQHTHTWNLFTACMNTYTCPTFMLQHTYWHIQFTAKEHTRASTQEKTNTDRQHTHTMYTVTFQKYT